MKPYHMVETLDVFLLAGNGAPPDAEEVEELVADALGLALLEGGVRPYAREGEFFRWYPSNASGEGFTRVVLIDRGLSAASVNLALAALRKIASEAAAHGGLSPPTAAGVRGVPGATASGPATG